MQTIFVSSTFQDMQQERDSLRDNVLPRVKELLKQYGTSIELCDLRWGVNSLGLSESESAMKVLQICFDEIDNAKPFFIVLLGDRYGWIPDRKIVKRILNDRKIEDDNYLGKSVTEMEIIYGAFNSDNTDNVLFCFREISNKSELPHVELTESVLQNNNHIENLKKRILDRFPDKVCHYTLKFNPHTGTFEGLDDFSDIIYRHLEKSIKKQFSDRILRTEYDSQYYQYQYSLQSKVLFSAADVKIITDKYCSDTDMVDIENLKDQLLLLVSENENTLSQVFGRLYMEWCGRASVFPYCCGESVLSSSLKNMFKYFISILSDRYAIRSEEYIVNDNNYKEQFCNILKIVDKKTDQPIVLMIQGIQYLDVNDFSKWLPAVVFDNIIFMVSSNKSKVVPSVIKNVSREIFLPSNAALNLYNYVLSYMSFFRKEADENLCEAIIEKSEGRNELYSEMIMQRLILLSQSDFEAIKQRGDGIDNISSYLIEIVNKAPNTVYSLISEQIAMLESETDPSFVRSVLAVLCILPYGIPKDKLEEILISYHIPYIPLYMVLFCRRLQFAVNDTLDGFYRLVMNRATVSFSSFVAEEILLWTEKIDKFFEQQEKEMLLHNKKADEFYRSNRLLISQKNSNNRSLSAYLKLIEYDEGYLAALLRKILGNNQGLEWMKLSVKNLPFSDLEWFVLTLYDYISKEKMLLDSSFAKVLMPVWETITELAEEAALRECNKNYNYCWFRSAFEAGEIAYLSIIESAAKYLCKAKEISKLNFKMYPNSLWKSLHGQELSEEEKKMHYYYPEQSGNNEEKTDNPVMLGFDSELEDTQFEQSWSSVVRIINNYLSDIYRRTGKIKAAEGLEHESGIITHMADPDPKNKGKAEVVPGITVIWPDQLEPSSENNKKHSYKPDYRRNTAIQMSKESLKYRNNGNKLKSIELLKESNDILMEIYNDGETCQYYDLVGVVGDIAEIGRSIRMECSRDIGLNYRNMLPCFEIVENDPELNHVMDEMIKWAEIYDDYKNNMQSKDTLSEFYLVRANIYLGFEKHKLYFDKIVADIKKYYDYRIQCIKLGQQMDNELLIDFNTANHVIYEVITHCPECGDDVVEMLLKCSNDCVVSNDINGFIKLTVMLYEMIIWMYEHNWYWKCSRCSLEQIFVANMDNQSMLWYKHRKTDFLCSNTDMLVKTIHYIKETENVKLIINSIMRNIFCLVDAGNFSKASEYADHILFLLLKFSETLPEISVIDTYNNIIAIYTEAGRIYDALRLIPTIEKIYEEIYSKNYSQEYQSQGISYKKFLQFLATQYLKMQLNIAIVYSKSENMVKAEEYLRKAESYLQLNPEQKYENPDLAARVEYFVKNGFHYSDKQDNTQSFRVMKENIEKALENAMKGNFSESDLAEIEKKVKLLLDIPESEFLKNHYTIAKYYHTLFMLYCSKNDETKGIENLKKAVAEAEEDTKICNLYGEIYSDMGSKCKTLIERISLFDKSKRIFEELEKNEEDYSKNSYAILLNNYAIILCRMAQYQEAYQYARKAEFLWKSLYSLKPNPQLKEYIWQIERLKKFIMSEI